MANEGQDDLITAVSKDSEPEILPIPVGVEEGSILEHILIATGAAMRTTGVYGLTVPSSSFPTRITMSIGNSPVIEMGADLPADVDQTWDFNRTYIDEPYPIFTAEVTLGPEIFRQNQKKMFKSGKKPAITIAESGLKRLVTRLFAAGYSEHDGRKTKMRGEVLTFRKKFITDKGKDRQNHVQLVHRKRSGRIAVFAHTEPYMGRSIGSLIAHGISAFTDRISYQAGARMLKADLKSVSRI